MLGLFIQYKETEQALSQASTIATASLAVSSIAASRIFQWHDGVMIGLVLSSFAVGHLVKICGLRSVGGINNKIQSGQDR